MKFRLIWYPIAAALIMGCSPEPEAAPPGLTVASASPDGLYELFRTECIEQRHRAWARQQAEREIAQSCFPFDRDCRDQIDGSYSWSAPLSDGSSAEVDILWLASKATPDEPHSCSLEVDAQLADSLLEAANRIANGNSEWGPSEQLPQSGGVIHYWDPRAENQPLPQLLYAPFSDQEQRVYLRYNAEGRFPGT